AAVADLDEGAIPTAAAQRDITLRVDTDIPRDLRRREARLIEGPIATVADLRDSGVARPAQQQYVAIRDDGDVAADLNADGSIAGGPRVVSEVRTAVADLGDG